MTKIPWNTKKNTVALSATASVKFHYGVTAEQVSNVCHCILDFHLQLSPVFYSPPRVPMDCSWTAHSAHGVLMDCSWTAHGPHGVLMDCSWSAHGVLMDCS